MIVILDRGASVAQVEEALRQLEALGLRVRLLRPGEVPLVHVLSASPVEAAQLRRIPGVSAVLLPLAEPPDGDTRRFYPYHFINWCIAALLLLSALALLAGFAPPGLGLQVDLQSPPASLQPPWYFLWLDRWLHAFPPTQAAIPILLLALAVLLLFFLPRLARLFALAVALSVGANAGAQTQVEQCIVCHGEEGQQIGRSVHSSVGVNCTTCHGGRADSVLKDEAHGSGMRRTIAGRDAVELCAGCHADVEKMRPYGLRTDQLLLYKTSVHGHKLFEEGDPGVATCVSCHGPHSILRVTDPLASVHKLRIADTCGKCHGDAALMARYGKSADPVQQYRQSVHGVALLENHDLVSPSCADCHGSHGAAPPRAQDVGTVCGQCHSVNRQYFAQSPHFITTAANMMEECTSCHGQHAIARPSLEMFSGDAEGHCGSCHSGEKDPGIQVSRALHDGLTALTADIEKTAQLLREASANGVFLEDEQGYLDEARAVLVLAGPLSHTVSRERVDALLKGGKAMIDETLESLDVKSRSLRDRKFMTLSFALLCLVFIGILLVRRSEVRR